MQIKSWNVEKYVFDFILDDVTNFYNQKLLNLIHIKYYLSDCGLTDK